jgi:hypothetical protein
MEFAMAEFSESDFKCGDPKSIGSQSRPRVDDGPREKPSGKKPSEFVIPLNLIFASVALMLASAALGFTYFRDPLGKGIKAYDFSTPRAALESEAQIMINQDVRAIMQKDEFLTSKTAKERLKSIEIRREEEWRGKVILFIASTENGIKRHYIGSSD